MGSDTKIQWADHTFNPWRGCSKIAAGCANCYADAQSKRNPGVLGVWGPSGTRVVASEAMWRQPLKWQRMATGVPPHGWPNPSGRARVFCESLADVFEDWPGQCKMSDGGWCVKHRKWGELTGFGSCALSGGNDAVRLDDVRARLFATIDATQNLDWLLLTKRPENIRRMWPGVTVDRDESCDSPKDRAFARRRDNVWLGVSIARQDDADRLISELIKCRDLCAKIFLSIEPLLGPIDLSQWLYVGEEGGWEYVGSRSHLLDWVIVGGESGPSARPCHVEWIRSIVRQCKAAGLPVFVKQLGAVCEITGEHGAAWPHDPESWGRYDECSDRWFATWRDKKGGDPAEWPEDLRVREVPT